MTDWRKEARRAALQAGIDPNIFERQINAESGFNPAARSQYAVGIAQFTPETARGLGIDPNNPKQALHGAAQLMASYVRKYGSYENALVAYNAGPARVGRPLYKETRDYIARIMGSSASGASPPGRTKSMVVANTANPTIGFDQAGYQQAQRMALLSKLLASQGQNQYNNPLFATGVLGGAEPQTQDFITSGTEYLPSIAANVMRTRPTSSPTSAGTFKIAPGAMRPGTRLAGELQNYLSDTAGRYGRPLTVGTGTNHSKLTVNGRVSDHWDGHGADIPVPVDSHQGDAIAASALEEAGIPRAQAQQMARRGGLYTVTPERGRFKGRRVQVIWKTYEGGNHHNHVHIGVR